MLIVANEDRIPLCEAEISNLSIGPLHLHNLLLTSCLHLGTMRHLSFIGHRAMMLECVLIFGFWNMFFLGEVSRESLKILDVGRSFVTAAMNMHNNDCLASAFEERGHSRKWGNGKLLFMQ